MRVLIDVPRVNRHKTKEGIMAGVQTELLFEMRVELDRETGQWVGATSRGTRLIGYIKGGTFEGPQLKGEVLPGGGDWLLIRPDGVREPDVRLTLRTEDGHLIYMAYRSIFRIAPELLERIRQGEAVDPSAYYLRTTPIFETTAEKYGWLNQVVAVGIGTRTPTGLLYTVYTIL
jgi:hypothetical protein